MRKACWFGESSGFTRFDNDSSWRKVDLPRTTRPCCLSSNLPSPHLIPAAPNTHDSFKSKHQPTSPANLWTLIKTLFHSASLERWYKANHKYEVPHLDLEPHRPLHFGMSAVFPCFPRLWLETNWLICSLSGSSPPCYFRSSISTWGYAILRYSWWPWGST